MRYFDTHTHSPRSTDDVMSLYNLRVSSISRPPAVGFFSVGIHPYDALAADAIWIEHLQLLARHDRCIAIGETGIDHRAPDIERQKEIFAAHCAIANELQKPMIIHCVRSQGEILSISDSVEAPRIFHSYSRVNEEISRAAGIIYSLSPRNFARSLAIPLDQILLETDDSAITIEEVYAQFAASRNLSTEVVARVVENNFFRIFAQ